MFGGEGGSTGPDGVVAARAMAGGTTFHFVTEGILPALERTRAAAGGREARIGGGVATIRQYLQAGLVDELHLAVSPVLPGRGEALLAGLDPESCGLRQVRCVPGEGAGHFLLSPGALKAHALDPAAGRMPGLADR